MCRCLACDKILNDYEATRKFPNGSGYVDLCNTCFSYIQDDLNVVEERYDLDESSNIEREMP